MSQTKKWIHDSNILPQAKHRRIAKPLFSEEEDDAEPLFSEEEDDVGAIGTCLEVGDEPLFSEEEDDIEPLFSGEDDNDASTAGACAEGDGQLAAAFHCRGFLSSAGEESARPSCSVNWPHHPVDQIEKAVLPHHSMPSTKLGRKLLIFAGVYPPPPQLEDVIKAWHYKSATSGMQVETSESTDSDREMSEDLDEETSKDLDEEMSEDLDEEMSQDSDKEMSQDSDKEADNQEFNAREARQLNDDELLQLFRPMAGASLAVTAAEKSSDIPSLKATTPHTFAFQDHHCCHQGPQSNSCCAVLASLNLCWSEELQSIIQPAMKWVVTYEDVYLTSGLEKIKTLFGMFAINSWKCKMLFWDWGMREKDFAVMPAPNGL
ncbi:hypothetical protein L208DRAFT_1382574 [Tricholoma matsutake]|nr:hypothetical protein L208DRAFT_1382574 [Tricholoma matsutake 945]